MDLPEIKASSEKCCTVDILTSIALRKLFCTVNYMYDKNRISANGQKIPNPQHWLTKYDLYVHRIRFIISRVVFCDESKSGLCFFPARQVSKIF